MFSGVPTAGVLLVVAPLLLPLGFLRRHDVLPVLDEALRHVPVHDAGDLQQLVPVVLLVEADVVEEDAGVPVVPGCLWEGDPSALEAIGYPVLLREYARNIGVLHHFAVLVQEATGDGVWTALE